jgi:hypothetical protein
MRSWAAARSRSYFSRASRFSRAVCRRSETALPIIISGLAIANIR